jgi:hypothetical protein
MKIYKIAITAALTAGVAITAAAGAGSKLTSGRQAAAQPVQGKYAPVTARGVAAGQIVRKWSAYVKEVYGTAPNAWAKAMGGSFAQADLHNMQRAATMTTFEGMMATLMGQQTTDAKIIDQLAAATSADAVMALGSPGVDLVFTAVTPCRIVDTRVVGGMIPTDGVRDFNSSGTDFLAQGGSETDCGIPADVAAVIMNVTVVDSTRMGYLTVFPYGLTRPLASALNYLAGEIKGNELISRQTMGQPFDFSIYANGETHVVVDVAGYFSAALAMEPECVTANGTLSQVSPGQTYAISATCPIGFTVVGGGPRVAGGSPNLTTSESYPQGSSWFVSGRNPSGVQEVVQARANCCRVPGR